MKMQLKKAREEFLKEILKYIDEIEKWDNIKFLDKAKLTIQGKITRASVLFFRQRRRRTLSRFGSLNTLRI